MNNIVPCIVYYFICMNLTLLIFRSLVKAIVNFLLIESDGLINAQ